MSAADSPKLSTQTSRPLQVPDSDETDAPTGSSGIQQGNNHIIVPQEDHVETLLEPSLDGTPTLRDGTVAINRSGSTGRKLAEAAESSCWSQFWHSIGHGLASLGRFLFSWALPWEYTNSAQTSFGHIITDTIQNTNLTELDYFEHNAEVKQQAIAARDKYFDAEDKLFTSVEAELKGCYDKDGKLDADKFKNWYRRYEAMVNAMVDAAIQSHRTHAKSGQAINAETDNCFTKAELNAFEQDANKIRNKALNLTQGAFKFPVKTSKIDETGKETKVTLSKATNNLLDDNGIPNFSSKKWEEDTELVNDIFDKNKMQKELTVLTRDLRQKEGDVIEGIGGLHVPIVKDGEVKSDLSLQQVLKDNREQFARDVVKPAAREFFQSIIEDLEDAHANPSELRKSQQKALNSYIGSRAYRQAKSENRLADQIRAMPLEYVFDIAAAMNFHDIIWKVAPDGPDFVRLQEAHHFLPSMTYQRIANPSRNWDIRWEGEGSDNAILFDKDKYSIRTASLPSELQNVMSTLTNECNKYGAQVALFSVASNKPSTAQEPQKYVLQVNMHLPSTQREQNPGYVNKILEAAEGAKRDFEKIDQSCNFMINIGGDINVTPAQYKKMEEKQADDFMSLPGNLIPPEENLAKGRSWDWQLNQQPRKGKKQQIGGVITAYTSGSRSNTQVIMGAAARETNRAMAVAVNEKPDGRLVIDTNRSLMSDHEALITTTVDEHGNEMSVVDFNQLNSCTERFQHRIPEKSENHERHRPLNSVLKFKLAEEIVHQAEAAWNKAEVA